MGCTQAKYRPKFHKKIETCLEIENNGTKHTQQSTMVSKSEIYTIPKTIDFNDLVKQIEKMEMRKW